MFILRRNEKTGIVTKTHQQAYISANVEDIVISCEAMESLRFVSDLYDRKKASVRLVSSTVMHPYYGKSLSPVQSSPMVGKSLSPGASLVDSPVASGLSRLLHDAFEPATNRHDSMMSTSRGHFSS